MISDIHIYQPIVIVVFDRVEIKVYFKIPESVMMSVSAGPFLLILYSDFLFDVTFFEDSFLSVVIPFFILFYFRNLKIFPGILQEVHNFLMYMYLKIFCDVFFFFFFIRF